MADTVSPGGGFEPDGAAFKRAVVFAVLGVLSGVVAGLVEWSEYFAYFYIELPVPGTGRVWYLATYTIAHGVVFGICVALALQRYRIARENHLMLIVAATTIAAFLASNIASDMIPDGQEGDVETTLWVLIGVVEGVIFSGITMAALAAMIPLYRNSQKIFPVLIAGAGSGGLAVLVAFAMLYPELEDEADPLIALALPLLVYTAIMLAGIGAALGAVSRPPGNRPGNPGGTTSTVSR